MATTNNNRRGEAFSVTSPWHDLMGEENASPLRSTNQMPHGKRLLIVTPFDENVRRVTTETVNQRNHFMAELADKIFVAYALPGGNIENLITDISQTGKTISSFKTIYE